MFLKSRYLRKDFLDIRGISDILAMHTEFHAQSKKVEWIIVQFGLSWLMADIVSTQH